MNGETGSSIAAWQRRCAATLAALCVGGMWLGCAPEASRAAVSGTTAAGVYYEAFGSGEPVVLIHAFSLDRRGWDPQMEALGDEFRVIRYDLRGHGNSSPPTVPYTAYDDLRDVLDALQVDRASLVGLLAGAQVATDFVLTYPDRVKKLVLASPGLSGYVPKASFDWFAPIAEAAGAGDLERAADLWAETEIMAIRTDSAANAKVRAIVRDNAALWSYQNRDRALSPPAIGRLSEILVPVLVVVGERDMIDMHAVADTLVTCVAGARKETLPQVGHLLNLAAPARFTELALTFLREDEAGAPAPAGSPCVPG